MRTQDGLKIHGIEIEHERSILLNLLGDIWSSRPALHNIPGYNVTDRKWKNRMKPQERPPLPHTHIPAWHPARKFLLGHV